MRNPAEDWNNNIGFYSRSLRAETNKAFIKISLAKARACSDDCMDAGARAMQEQLPRTCVGTDNKK
jgi:hypothetical protein